MNLSVLMVFVKTIEHYDDYRKLIFFFFAFPQVTSADFHSSVAVGNQIAQQFLADAGGKETHAQLHQSVAQHFQKP